MILQVLVLHRVFAFQTLFHADCLIGVIVWRHHRQFALPVPDLCSHAVFPNHGHGLGPNKVNDLSSKVKFYYVILTTECVVRNLEGAKCTHSLPSSCLALVQRQAPLLGCGAWEHLFLVLKALICPLKIRCHFE